MTGSDIRIAATVAALRDAAERAGLNISLDGRVTEATAARLFGLSPAGMRKMRNERRGPIWRRLPFDNCSITYRLVDLALWTEQVEK